VGGIDVLCGEVNEREGPAADVVAASGHPENKNTQADSCFVR
jgi:hypothetical protein